MTVLRLVAAASGALALAACNADAPTPAAEQTEIPDEIANESIAPVAAQSGQIGTPMAERVATLGLLNKRNNISREIQLRPGESQRIDDVIIRLSACERTAPWENPPLTGAFVQVLIETREDAGSDPEWRRVFSGWLYKEAPAVNVVEHPIYDVWMKDCAMSFPGEDTVVAPPAPAASGTPAAPPTAAPSAAATPAAAPATPAEN